MTKVILVYRTSDSQEFDNIHDASEHQADVNRKSGLVLIENLDRFRNSYNYNQLMRDHNLSDEGLWEILGEDPNCDLGGHHHNPFLGRVDGRLDKVIEWAVMQPGFWHWGAGGRIVKLEMDNVIHV